ncbi:aspartic proteinase 36-like [Impatiens glandulifera]|uniref:aspartic proteinase 36-like n=1 Tax=Impatiens glandulifera TaxID=253017 RepID=UPI001FB10171|nr:aspartic proteinase 36-like [Impatiens glandulifera]
MLRGLVLAVFWAVLILCYTDVVGHKVLSLSRVLSEDLEAEELEPLRSRDLLRFSTTLHGKGTPKYSLLGTFRNPYIGGCSTFHSGRLTQKNQAIDGILGLGYLYPSVVMQLSIERVIPNEIFSHCLGADGNSSLVLGEFDHRDAAIVYTPLVPETMHDNLDLRSITVNGKALPINHTIFNTSSRGLGRGTFVDSGTSLSYLVAEAYDAFIDAINSAIGTYPAPIVYNGKLCYKMSSSELDRFPLVGFNFAGNASKILKPKDYLLRSRPLIDGAPSLCIGFHKSMVHNVTILGYLVLKDKLIIYDIAHQQLGWSDYFNCSMNGLHRSHVGQIVTGNQYMLMAYLFFIIFI